MLIEKAIKAGHQRIQVKIGQDAVEASKIIKEAQELWPRDKLLLIDANMGQYSRCKNAC